mmetsp:Transcript_2929/g.4260  ORF Transcript_2929/g.4260 Transcript_2929/m.4260 type:complete len:291 (-) Transcript_2929:1057-1929(-)
MTIIKQIVERIKRKEGTLVTYRITLYKEETWELTIIMEETKRAFHMKENNNNLKKTVLGTVTTNEKAREITYKQQEHALEITLPNKKTFLLQEIPMKDVVVFKRERKTKGTCLFSIEKMKKIFPEIEKTIATSQSSKNTLSKSPILYFYRTILAFPEMKKGQIDIRIDRYNRFGDMFVGFVDPEQPMDYASDFVGETTHSWGVFVFDYSVWHQNRAIMEPKERGRPEKGDLVRLEYDAPKITFYKKTTQDEKFILLTTVTLPEPKALQLGCSFGDAGLQFSIVRAKISNK